ncbi:MAG: hypothetical protein AAGL23_01800 [Pseudomonadota bacterium]
MEARHALPSSRAGDYGRRARSGGDPGAAVQFFEMALRLDPANRSAAADLGKGIVASGDVARWSALPPETQHAVLTALDPPDLIRMSAMTPLDVADHIAIETLSVEDLCVFVEKLDHDQKVQEAAAMIAEWKDQNGGAMPSHAGVRAMIDRWFDQSQRAKSMDARIALLDAVLMAQPLHADARIALRDIRRDVLAHARALAAKGDRLGLESLSQQVQRLPYDLPEIDLHLARVAFDSDAHEAALRAGMRASDDFADNVALWALLMRSAFTLENYVLADKFAAQVITCADAATERLEHEAAKRRDRIPVLAYQAARVETDDVALIGLYRVAERHPDYGPSAARKRAAAEASVINRLRELQVANSDDFIPYLTRVLDVMPKDPRVLMSAGRFFVKQKDFAKARHYWQNLTKIEPTNEEAQFQHGRCIERIRESQVA